VKQKIALKARGWAFQNFQGVLAPKAAARLPANPAWRSDDSSAAASANLLALKPMFWRLSDILQNSNGSPIAFSFPTVFHLASDSLPTTLESPCGIG